MTEKSKRKGNPRRNLLLRIVIILLLIATVVSMWIVAYQASTQKTQIIFIAPDDEGIDAIWIADLNNPENPRQLTTSDWTGHSLHYELQVSLDGNSLLFETNGTEFGTIRDIFLLDLKTGDYELVMTCGLDTILCNNIRMSPHGRFVAYQDSDYSLENPVLYMMLYDTRAKTHHLIYEFQATDRYFYDTALQWMGHTGMLFFMAEENSQDYIFYDVDNMQISERRTLNLIERSPIFSDDGLRYGFKDALYASEDTLRILYLRHIDFSDEQLISFDAIDEPDAFIIIDALDWHPDNEAILVNEYRQQGDEPSTNQAILYNTLTGEREILLDEAGAYYDSVRFNQDGTQLLYWRTYRDAYTPDAIMIYDMETGESTQLPLDGWSPTWVEGR